MKNLKWIVAIVLVAVIAASAWLLVSRRTEKSTPPLPPEERSAPVDLTRFLPTGAVAVVHYTGGEALQSAYGQSALGQIINDSQMQEFLRKPAETLYRGFTLGGKGSHADSKVNQQLCHWLISKESAAAVYIADKPQVAVCVRLGDDAPRARAFLKETTKGDTSVSRRMFQGNEVAGDADQQLTIAKDVFVFATDSNLLDAVLERIDAAAPPTETVAAPTLQVGQQIGFAVVDLPVILQKVRASLKDAADFSRCDAVLKELGAEQIQRIECAAGFDGAGIRTAARVSGLTPGSGLFAMYGNRSPLDDAALRLVPKDAASASIARIDLAALWDAVMRAVEVMGGHEVYQEAQAAIATFEGEAKVHVKEELIDSAGDVLAFYIKPPATPMVPAEMTLVLGLKEPQKFSEGMNRLLEYANKQLAAYQPPRGRASPWIQRAKIGDVDVSFLGGMPMMSPAFAVKGPYAYLAASPTALRTAIDQADHPQSSLLDNPDYQATRAKFPEKVVAVTFEDTRQIVAQLYTTISALRPMFEGHADAPADLDLLPPLSKVQEKLFGGVGVVTADGNELMLQQYSAFGVNFNSFGGGGTPIMAALVFPAVSQARERARSANCQANLKQIGIACHQYADNHGGQFPESLDELVGGQLLSSNTVHCPSAPNAGGLSYTYCRGYTPKNIYRLLAFDADGNHRNGGRNVLFCDGHVEWMTDVKFRALLQKQM